MPKEKRRPCRAFCHPAFNGIDDFCLVYLKPDPPAQYLNDHRDIIDYFRMRIRNGISLAGQQYHLMGASNSQMKEHSYWFVHETSLDAVQQKRAQLGRFDQIRNLGTYVARVGLWFTQTDCTEVSLSNSSCASNSIDQLDQSAVLSSWIERSTLYR
jgi:hypothetical protein